MHCTVPRTIILQYCKTDVNKILFWILRHQMAEDLLTELLVDFTPATRHKKIFLLKMFSSLNLAGHWTPNENLSIFWLLNKFLRLLLILPIHLYTKVQDQHTISCDKFAFKAEGGGKEFLPINSRNLRIWGELQVVKVSTVPSPLILKRLLIHIFRQKTNKKDRKLSTGSLFRIRKNHYPASVSVWEADLDPHQSQKPDPDPNSKSKFRSFGGSKRSSAGPWTHTLGAWRVCKTDLHYFDKEQDLDPNPHLREKSHPDPDTHQSEKSDSDKDPQHTCCVSNPQHCWLHILRP
jgi:hypothetical protein